MTKYRVKETVNNDWYFTSYKQVDENLERAKQMIDDYGLTSFTPEQVKEKWENYSDSLAAGWIIPDKERIEWVFDVVLEEVSEETEE